MKMTGYYLFSQALSVTMLESSIVITISGVEPFCKPGLASWRRLLYNFSGGAGN